MPVEINEIAIQMQVGEEGESKDLLRRPSKSRATSRCGEDPNGQREQIVDDSVRRVLRALKAMRER